MKDDDHWQTRKSPIPVSPIPDFKLAGPGKRGGISRFPTPPESGIGKSPVARFARDRESRSRDRESGSRGRHRDAGDFLVCLRLTESQASSWSTRPLVPRIAADTEAPIRWGRVRVTRAFLISALVYHSAACGGVTTVSESFSAIWWREILEFFGTHLQRSISTGKGCFCRR